uniref:Ig-like domain-containing protein n=1 Tax=Acrobeloides nanus TaxID=290746 RepID=A0A914DFI5_9BILA
MNISNLYMYSGIWTCSLTTAQNQTVNGTIEILLRPVAFKADCNYVFKWRRYRNLDNCIDNKSSLQINFKRDFGVKLGDFELEASGVKVFRDESTEVDCPVIGFPDPIVYWMKEDQNITEDEHYSFDGTILKISNATYAHDGTYTCIAKNSFNLDGIEQTYELKIDRKLFVKNPFSWIWPLIVIIVILVVLILIIKISQSRRKKNGQRLLEKTPNEE